MECCYCGGSFIYTRTKRKSGYNRKSVNCKVKKNISLSIREFLSQEGIDVNNNDYVCLQCFKLTRMLYNGKTRYHQIKDSFKKRWIQPSSQSTSLPEKRQRTCKSLQVKKECLKYFTVYMY